MGLRRQEISRIISHVVVDTGVHVRLHVRQRSDGHGVEVVGFIWDVSILFFFLENNILSCTVAYLTYN
jgi:hypothetical protein